MDHSEKSSRILICEDIFLNFFVLEQLLKTAYPNASITHAVDGVDGSNKFNNDSFDVIITDIEMPNMNGWEFIRYIQSKSYPNDKIIIISAHSEQLLSIKADQLNIRNYFTKPISRDKMKAITAIIESAIIHV